MEPAVIAMWDWPAIERLTQQMAQTRTADWNARVALTAWRGEATVAYLSLIHI